MKPDSLRQLLFVLWDGGGNITPQLAIVRRLVKRGHGVRVLAPAHLAERITAAGATHVPFRDTPEHDSASVDRDLLRDWQAKNPMEAAGMVGSRVMVGTALAYGRDTLAALDDHGADVVVADYMILGAYLAAERRNLPLVTLIHHVYPMPLPGVPPFGLGLAPAVNALGRLRDRLLGPISLRLFLGSPTPLNAARTALGLKPVPRVLDMFEKPDRSLVLTSKAFDYPFARLPERVRAAGFPIDNSGETPEWVNPWNTGDTRPLVVASFSTTFQNQATHIRHTIQALASLPVRGLVTTGPAIAPATFPTTPNVVIQTFAPHRQVFPQAATVITHGGHGTVLTALSCGVPVLAMPMGRDQPDIAARLTYHGAGVRLNNISPEAISRQVQKLISDQSYRAAAQRIADVMSTEDGAGTAADEIEHVAKGVRQAVAP